MIGSGAPAPFVPFGPDHLAALGVVALVSWLAVASVRAWPAAAPLVRGALATGIVALTAFEMATGAQEGWLTWTSVLPLDLCDAALVLSVVALLRPRRPLAELVYFWAGSGSTLAMLTPDLQWSYPRFEFVVFFGLHGLALAAALVLVFGLGLHPRAGAPLRVFAITVGWTAFVGVVDALVGTNFMYLRSKPLAATPLDWMGAWPVYVGTAALLALALFQVLALPFRREWPRGSSSH
jgi:hypothetical integral membrane protein (TIGR02206 family)